jgi:hypothetical protein
MSDLKSFVDRMRAKSSEVTRKAVRRAAGLALSSAGRAVQRVVFGAPDGAEQPSAEAPPDPFAKLKEREREEKRQAEARAAAKRKEER